MDTKISTISVRNLVEFLKRSGDIDNRTGGMPDTELMLAGSRIHRRLQAARGEGFRAEVPLRDDLVYDDVTLRIEGRADGILEEDGRVIIEEIKAIVRDVAVMEAPVPVHLAQARLYSAIWQKQNGPETIGVRMTYFNLETEEVRTFDLTYTREENAAWYRELADEWHRWIALRENHRASRAASMTGLAFPFTYRPGQKRLVASVYRTITEGKQLFIEAPTGVGKTMSVLYPSIRAVGEGRAERIFYLTAKAVTRAVPVEALEILHRAGLDFQYTVLTAKEKICPMHETACNPDDCPLAKGHYDRVNAVLFRLLSEGYAFDGAAIAAAAAEERVCPFELSLDIAVWTDAVICDYNYAFDPNARLRRFFGDGVKSEGILLIDEAHNLVDRGREMFGGFIRKSHVLGARRVFKAVSPKAARSLERLNRRLLSGKKDLEDSGTDCRRCAGLSDIETAAMRAMGDMQAFFGEEGNSRLFTEVSDFFFELRDFLSAADRMDDRYVICEEKDDEGDYIFRIRCVDPSAELQAVMDRSVATVLFSATLLPIDYYRALLSGREDDYAVYAETPFSADQRRIIIGRRTGTRYTDRGEAMYRRIAGAIHDTVCARRGNYMAFFPSYKVMEAVFEVYRREYDEPDVNWVVQSRSMFDEDRQIFLENFYEDPEQSLIGFCVMGGIFSEGIDLTGTRLIGAIVVGTGLPQISGEREILRQYYDDRGMDGFDYAYRIPGMNKVEQAAGRVIRTAGDRGVIVLLDRRFLGADYRRLFPREWQDAVIADETAIGEILDKFWNGDEKGMPPVL